MRRMEPGAAFVVIGANLATTQENTNDLGQRLAAVAGRNSASDHHSAGAVLALTTYLVEPAGGMRLRMPPRFLFCEIRFFGRDEPQVIAPLAAREKRARGSSASSNARQPAARG
jgi:hypothetical protein